MGVASTLPVFIAVCVAALTFLCLSIAAAIMARESIACCFWSSYRYSPIAILSRVTVYFSN